MSGDPEVIAPAGAPFSADGGLKLLAGNLGRAIIKTSAVKPAHRVVMAPALVFDSQDDVISALNRSPFDGHHVLPELTVGPKARLSILY